MTKESIIERLLDQGHIVMTCADRILNKKAGYIQDLESLHRDGNINTKESLRLLTEPRFSQSNESLIARHKTKLSYESMGETCRNGKLWKDCTCC
jgi:hypothetical protein